MYRRSVQSRVRSVLVSGDIMKRLILLAVAIQALAAPQPPAASPNKSDPKAKSAAPAKPVRPVNVPPEAKLNDEGFWRYVDKQGKTWIYQPTPFGLMKHEEIAAKKANDPKIKAQIEEAANLVKAVEDGDIVRFSRPGPFGVYSWTRKKSELTDDEKAMLERSSQKSATNSEAKSEVKD